MLIATIEDSVSNSVKDLDGSLCINRAVFIFKSMRIVLRRRVIASTQRFL